MPVLYYPSTLTYKLPVFILRYYSRPGLEPRAPVLESGVIIARPLRLHEAIFSSSFILTALKCKYCFYLYIDPSISPKLWISNLYLKKNITFNLAQTKIISIFNHKISISPGFPFFFNWISYFQNDCASGIHFFFWYKIKNISICL